MSLALRVSFASLTRREPWVQVIVIDNKRPPLYGGFLLCPGEDLNLHGVSPTATSRLRVYQFHHLGSVRYVVRERGVEPPRPCEHWNLNPARLPFRHSRVLVRGKERLGSIPPLARNQDMC